MFSDESGRASVRDHVFGIHDGERPCLPLITLFAHAFVHTVDRHSGAVLGELSVQRIGIDSAQESFGEAEKVSVHLQEYLDIAVLEQPSLQNSAFHSDIGADVMIRIVIEREMCRRDAALLHLLRGGRRAEYFQRALSS